MADLPEISSIQCVDALWRLGFAIEDTSDRRVRLVRADGRRVFVPRHQTIVPGELRVILLVAGIEDEAFVAMLQRRSSSGKVGGFREEITGLRERHPELLSERTRTAK